MTLTVSLAQIAVAAGRPEENLAKGERLVAEAAGRGSDLIVFPEMWTSGFSWEGNADAARDHEAVVARIGAAAKRHKIWIGGSTLGLNDDGHAANTFTLFDADGRRAAVYRKAHLFSFLGEERRMAPGERLVVADCPWGKTGLAICYDLRFPELFRTYALAGAVLVLTPAAFPHPRLPHWRILSRARAIENQMYFVGVNQVGTEDLGPDGQVTYFGSSVAVDPWGETLAEASEDREELLTVTLDPDRAAKVRDRMRVLSDRRPDLYKL